ncbi:GPN-loop GTPase [Gracilaria domingensis]|nr:GPN-loop GTPase [Gracilaria domingensis]
MDIRVRDAVVFNMDPANEILPYEAAADISELVNVETVASELSLGPNGSLLYAMEFLERNIEWLNKKLAENRGKYVVFDFPGQIELYTHNECIRTIVQSLDKRGYRLTQVNMVDAHYCADAAKFIAVMLTSATMMLQLELPAVNVLSKVDLIEQYGTLSRNLDFYTEVGDLGKLLEELGQDPRLRKYAKLNEAIVDVVEDFPFVSYHTLDIQNKESVMRLVKAIDKSNGYMYANLDGQKVTYDLLVGKPDMDNRWVAEVQERYMK